MEFITITKDNRFGSNGGLLFTDYNLDDRRWRIVEENGEVHFSVHYDESEFSDEEAEKLFLRDAFSDADIDPIVELIVFPQRKLETPREFTCPECGKHEIDQVSYNLAVVNCVKLDKENLEVDYDYSYQFETEDAVSIEYECARCGWKLPVASLYELQKYLDGGIDD